MNDTNVFRGNSEVLIQTQAQTQTQKILTRVRGLAEANRRRAEQCFWAEGLRNFIHAVESHWPIEAVVHSSVLMKGDFAEKILRRKKREGLRCVRVSPEQFRSISIMERASGVGVILRQRWTPLKQVDPKRGLCMLAIEEIRSPGNLGTILRTAEACGVGVVVFLSDRADPFHPAVVRASMGGLLHIPLARATRPKLRQWATHHEIKLLGLSPEGAMLWSAIPQNQNQKTMIVLGEERQGLSRGLREMCDGFVRLPMCGSADSLNVSIAAGVMMYEFVRRRHAINAPKHP